MPDQARVDIALVHYPVYNKQGTVTVSAVTNLDLHDLARLAKTYGLRAFHVVTPLEEQQAFVTGILQHWLLGSGATHNKDRANALALIKVKSSIELAKRDLYEFYQKGPIVLATGAKKTRPVLGMKDAKELLTSDCPILILFGTAWGLTNEVLEDADYVLPPVRGVAGYNHLSVRTAAAIILDRLLGDRE